MDTSESEKIIELREAHIPPRIALPILKLPIPLKHPPSHRRMVSFTDDPTKSPKPETPTPRSTGPGRLDLDLARPSMDMIRETGAKIKTKATSGAQAVGRVLKKSRKLILPSIDELPREEVVKRSKFFITKGRSAINSSLVLLLLLMTRIGPALMSGNNVIKLYGDVITYDTGWSLDDMNIWISYTYWAALCLSLLIMLGVRIFIYLLLPVLHDARVWIKKVSKTVVGIFDLFVSQLRYPTQFMIFILAVIVGCQLVFIFGVMYSNIYMVIVSRAVLGGCDGLVMVFQVAFVIRTFSKKHFALSVSFIISIDSLITSIMSFIQEIQYMYTFFWTAFAFCVFAFFCMLTVRSFDQADDSIFKMKRDDEDEIIEVKQLKTAVTIIFVILHSCMMIAVFAGLYMFPFYYGGNLWNLKNNGNSVNMANLLFLQQMISSARALLSPAIGAWLDPEIKKFTMLELNFFDRFLFLMKLYRRHIWSIVLGLCGAIICNYSLYFGVVIPDSSTYYFVSLFFGVSLAFLINSLWCIPMVLITNVTNQHHNDYYNIFISIMLFCINVSRFVVGSFVETEFVMRLIWFFLTMAVMVFVLIFFVFAAIGLVKNFYQTKFKMIDDVNLKFQVEEEPEQIPDIDMLKSPRVQKTLKEENKHSWKSLWYIFPMEALVLSFSVVLIGIYSGAFNLTIHFMFSSNDNFKWIKAFYLPVMFGLCLMSLRIGFPRFLKKMISVMFFKYTRKALGIHWKGTIAEKISQNPNFTIASNTIWSDPKLYKALSTEKLEKKPVLFVIPDQVFLKNEEDRITIRELDQNVALPKDLDIEFCGNGLIIVNEKKIKEKNQFDYRMLKHEDYLLKKYEGAILNLRDMNVHFYMWVFIGYCLFSIVPNVYRVIQKLICPTCKVDLFEDGHASLIRIVNFICGYFIIIPFISLWDDTSTFLEKISDITMIFKMETAKTLKTTKEDIDTKVTIEVLRKWDSQFKHLINMVSTKGEFIKYIFMFGIIIAKFSTIGFSTIALFVKFGVSNEIVQIVCLVIMMEIGVLKYLIQPAALITSDLNRIAMSCQDQYHAFRKILADKSITRTPEQIEKLEELSTYWAEMSGYWAHQVTVSWLTFMLKSKTLNLSYPIGASNFRSWCESSLYTVLPAIVVYFLKQFT